MCTRSYMNTRKKENSKFTLEAFSKFCYLRSILKKKPKKNLQSMPCGYSKLDMNPITLGWENSPKLPKNCKIRICLIFPVFWRFLGLGWSDWFLVFCIFTGSLRHKFRLPTRHTFFNFIFKMDCKERNFGNASSVNLFSSGVHIATCAQ